MNNIDTNDDIIIVLKLHMRALAIMLTPIGQILFYLSSQKHFILNSFALIN